LQFTFGHFCATLGLVFAKAVYVVDELLVSQMKELVKKGQSQNKVLPVSEAFKMYPVEDEVHEGKIEYWTSGDS